jgi:hypothetical protein
MLGLLLYKYKKDYLRATLCDLCTLKHFVELIAIIANSYLELKLTINIIYSYLQQFTLGFKQDISICILKQVRKLIINISIVSCSYYYLVEYKYFNANRQKAY